MTRMIRLLAFTLLCFPAQQVMADRVVMYTIDPSQTTVRFSWRDGGLLPASGVFKAVSGTIWGNHDRPELSRAEVFMQVKSLDTSVALLNNLLTRSGDFFKAQAFPEVVFKSVSLVDGDLGQGTFTLLGTLTVNGITQPVRLATRLAIKPQPTPDGQAMTVGFVADTTFKRSDFGMGGYGLFVSDDIKVNIHVQAIETQAFQNIQLAQRRP